MAAFILLVCIAPTMRIFTSMYHVQQDIVRENQRDHLAHRIHAKITEMLYKRQIHLSQDSKDQTIDLPDPELIAELKKLSYNCNATLKIVDSSTPKDEEHPNQYLAQLVIKFTDLSPRAQNKVKAIENQDAADNFYDYFIYIDAGEKNKDKDKGKKKDDDEKKKDSDKDKGKNDADKKKTPGQSLTPPKGGKEEDED